MPYRTNRDLPESVRHVLPAAAQAIFREAFNGAFAQYKDEVVAFKVAWTAVKRKYEKRGDRWVRAG